MTASNSDARKRHEDTPRAQVDEASQLAAQMTMALGFGGGDLIMIYTLGGHTISGTFAHSIVTSIGEIIALVIHGVTGGVGVIPWSSISAVYATPNA